MSSSSVSSSNASTQSCCDCDYCEYDRFHHSIPKRITGIRGDSIMGVLLKINKDQACEKNYFTQNLFNCD